MTNKILYSQVTKIAYEIDEKYYNGKHFVWCTDKPEYGPSQPPTSDPTERCQRFLSAIYSDDSHEPFIEENKKGIKLGAFLMRKKGTITRKEEKEIISQVSGAKLEEFSPLILVIDYSSVAGRLINVCASAKASSKSVEYQINDLDDSEFEIIDMSKAVNLHKLMKGR